MKPIKTLEEICKGDVFKVTINYKDYCNLDFNNDRLQTPYCEYRAKLSDSTGKYLCMFDSLEHYFKIQERMEK